MWNTHTPSIPHWKAYWIFFFSNFHLSSLQRLQDEPENNFPAVLSFLSCHFSHVTATLPNSPPFGWL
jgi:hypothetical protein